MRIVDQIALWWMKVDHARPLTNLLLTAGFHTAFTALCGTVGLSGHALFMYCFKEGTPFARAKVERRDPFPVSDRMKARGWTRAWRIADSIADVAGPLIVFLLFTFF